MPCMPKNCLLRQSYVIALADISYVYQISDQNNLEIFSLQTLFIDSLSE